MSTNNQTTRAVILDWAGTVLDFGSMAPLYAIKRGFTSYGIEVTDEQIREPMGRSKWEHLWQMLQMPAIASQWHNKYGQTPTSEDADKLFNSFAAEQLAVLKDHTTLFDGALQTVEWCRHHGIRIGSTTGYTRAMMNVVEPLAAAQGYAPECVVTADDIHTGRPAPWIVFEAMRRLDIYPPSAVVVVDDTVAGIQSAVNAGARAIGVTRTGSLVGLTEAEWVELSQQEQSDKLLHAEKTLREAGACDVIQTIAELPVALARFS